jgi:hypothetical protein
MSEIKNTVKDDTQAAEKIEPAADAAPTNTTPPAAQPTLADLLAAGDWQINSH